MIKLIFDETTSNAITQYFVFRGVISGLDESLTFEEVDSMLYEVTKNLDIEFAGEARTFFIELDNFDEENQQVEIIVGFTVWLYEDDETDIQLILETVEKQFDNIGITIDEKYYISDGPDRR